MFARFAFSLHSNHVTLRATWSPAAVLTPLQAWAQCQPEHSWENRLSRIRTERWAKPMAPKVWTLALFHSLMKTRLNFFMVEHWEPGVRLSISIQINLTSHKTSHMWVPGMLFLQLHDRAQFPNARLPNIELPGELFFKCKGVITQIESARCKVHRSIMHCHAGGHSSLLHVWALTWTGKAFVKGSLTNQTASCI